MTEPTPEPRTDTALARSTDPVFGEPLATPILDRRARLPRKPDPVTLEGPRFLLRPLALPTDLEALHAISDGRAIRAGELATDTYDPARLIWRYLSAGPFSDPTALGRWLALQDAAPDGRPLCVTHRATGQPVGVANLMSNHPEHLKIELGNIWYGRLAQGTGANTEATWLLLRHAFGLGYRRVEWKCDARNERSRAAALRMGFRFEGIQERHMIIRDRDRDTAWFRILDTEWPEVDAHLQRLGGLVPS
jgi:RimJ/RimL family protein N-acetyltransferase